MVEHLFEVTLLIRNFKKDNKDLQNVDLIHNTAFSFLIKKKHSVFILANYIKLDMMSSSERNTRVRRPQPQFEGFFCS